MRQYLIGLFCCIVVFSSQLVFGEDLTNDLVGIKFSDTSYSIVTEKQCPKKQAVRKFFELWSALVLPEGDFFIDLRADRGFTYQVPSDLLFVKWGGLLSDVDLQLKASLREIISDISDPVVRNFWQSYIKEKKAKPIELRIVIEPALASIIALNDGVLIKNLELKVTVNEPKPTVLGELLSQRLTMQINQSSDFIGLRSLAKTVLLAQYIREQSALGKINVPFRSEFGKKRLLSVKSSSEIAVLSNVQSFIRLSIVPIRIFLDGYKLKIKGAVDFASMMSVCEVKQIPITVSEALDRLEQFYLTDVGKLKISSQNPEDLINSYIKDKQMVPFWKKFLPKYKKEVIALHWAESLILEDKKLTELGIKLGSKIKGKWLKRAIRELVRSIGQSSRWINLLPDNAQIVFIGQFDPHLLPKEKERYLRETIKSGVIPFVSQLNKGEIVGMKIDERNKNFLLALLDVDKKGINRVISSNIEAQFYQAVRRIKIDFEDPFLKDVFLLSLVDTYKKMIDPRIVSIFPFIRSFLLEFSAVDLNSGLIKADEKI